MFNILVALDGSDHARSALELASDIATKYGATLHVINAIESNELADALRDTPSQNTSRDQRSGFMRRSPSACWMPPARRPKNWVSRM